MNYRRALRGDSRGLALLMEQLGYSISKQNIESKIDEFSKSPSNAIIIAEEKGEPIGVISCHVIPCLHQEASLGRITSLIIDARYRAMGIGSALLMEAEEYLAKVGCKRVEVTSSDKREHAHQFYLKHGFKEDERRFIKQYE